MRVLWTIEPQLASYMDDCESASMYANVVVQRSKTGPGTVW